MDLFSAITGRRTVHDFRADPVPQEFIKRMLEAAIWAPNHKLTNPWEFYVFAGAVKERLAHLRGELKRAKHPDPSSEQAQRSYERAYGELAGVPWAILVCQQVSPDPVRAEEDLLAVGCAIQNLMLAGHALGLGTFWSTGPLVNHPQTFAALGVPAGRRAVGLVFVGYPAEGVKAPVRRPVPEVTHWVE